MTVVTNERQRHNRTNDRHQFRHPVESNRIEYFYTLSKTLLSKLLSRVAYIYDRHSPIAARNRITISMEQR